MLSVQKMLKNVPKLKRGSSKGYKQQACRMSHARKNSAIILANNYSEEIQIGNYHSSQSQTRMKGSFELALEQRTKQSVSRERPYQNQLGNTGKRLKDNQTGTS